MTKVTGVWQTKPVKIYLPLLSYFHFTQDPLTRQWQKNKKILVIVTYNIMYIQYIKWKRFKKIAWIPSNHLHLQWKFKLWAGKFAWGVKAKHCWVLSTNFWEKKFVDNSQQCFAFICQANFPAHNLNYHRRWRWLNGIQAIFLNLFYFTCFW